MDSFAKFLSVNGLKKKDIAAFLGVSNAFITQLCNGTRTLPADKLALIKANEEWDSSMLKPTPNRFLVDAGELLSGLKKAREISQEDIQSAIKSAVFNSREMLLISYLQEKIADQDKLIHDLYKQIGMLEAKLEVGGKGETA